MKTIFLIVALALSAIASEPDAEEKAFLENVTRLLKATNGAELRKLVCWAGVSDEAKVSFDLEVGKAAGEADSHDSFASAALEPLRFPAHATQPPRTNLVPLKVLVLTFEGDAGGHGVMQWTIGRKDGRLMIGVPLKAKTIVK